MDLIKLSYQSIWSEGLLPIVRVSSMQKAKHILRDGYKFWVGDGQA